MSHYMPPQLTVKELAFTALAFCVAALPIAAIFAWTSPGLGGGVDADLFTNLVLTFLFFAYSIFFSLLLGVPMLAVLRSVNLVRWWACSLGGGAIGALVAVIIGNSDGPQFLLLCSTVGALSGIGFWAIRRLGLARANPDDRASAQKAN